MCMCVCVCMCVYVCMCVRACVQDKKTALDLANQNRYRVDAGKMEAVVEALAKRSLLAAAQAGKAELVAEHLAKGADVAAADKVRRQHALRACTHTDLLVCVCIHTIIAFVSSGVYLCVCVCVCRCVHVQDPALADAARTHARSTLLCVCMDRPQTHAYSLAYT